MVVSRRACRGVGWSAALVRAATAMSSGPAMKPAFVSGGMSSAPLLTR